jgi:hypothetical protein
MKRLYSSAARQWKKGDPGTKLFFEGSPVRILICINLLTEKNR